MFKKLIIKTTQKYDLNDHLNLVSQNILSGKNMDASWLFQDSYYQSFAIKLLPALTSCLSQSFGSLESWSHKSHHMQECQCFVHFYTSLPVWQLLAGECAVHKRTILFLLLVSTTINTPDSIENARHLQIVL